MSIDVPFPLVNTIPSLYKPDVPGVCYEGDTFLAYLSARDPEQEPVTYMLISGSLPSNAVLDPNLGTISGVLNLKHFNTGEELYKDHTWEFIVAGYDGVNSFTDPKTQQLFSITVKHINTPPDWLPGSGGLVLEMWEGDNISNAVLRTPTGLQVVRDDANAIVGWQIIDVIDHEFEADPSLGSISFTANTVDMPNGIVVSNTGIFSGTLPPISDNYIPKIGTTFTFDVIASDGELSMPRSFQIKVNNINVPPIWQTPEGSLGTFNEGDMANFQLVATDVDGDTLTYTISNGALPSGLSLTPDGVITGLPVNQAPGDADITGGTTWYFADPAGVNVTLVDQSWLTTADDGSTVFRSKPTDDVNHQFLTDTADVTPTPGATYRVSYVMRKVQDSTNGIIGYIRPAFDGFLTGNDTPVVLGQRDGPGYSSDPNNIGYDFFDTSVWTINEWVTVSAEYTLADPSPYVAIRGRLRLNRALFPNPGPPYTINSRRSGNNGPFSNEIVEVKGTAVTRTDLVDYNFTVTVTDGQYPVDRDFALTVKTVSQAPIWDTPPGSLGTVQSGLPFLAQVSAHDPKGRLIAYTITAGGVPPGIFFDTTTGGITGTVGNVTVDTEYDFTVSASNGILSTPENFSITVLKLPNGAPIWDTPAGLIFSGYVGDVNPGYQLVAHDPDGNSLTFSIPDDGSTVLPPGFALSPSGVISGTHQTPGTYDFIVAVSDGTASVTRSFEIQTLTAGGGSQEFTSDGDFTVPAGIHSLTFNWILAGGGGGGGGTEIGNGGGGGGGGGGGYYINYVMACSPGDVFHFQIGGMGIAKWPAVTNGNDDSSQFDGTNGGDTVIFQNGTEVLRATGGGGGKASPNVGAGYFVGAAGPPGTPNGNTALDGPVGTNDKASCGGGQGAGSPYPGSQFGAPGLGVAGPEPFGPGAGGNATGYGAGGGGGGSHDRSGNDWWSGGSGSPGYVQISY